MKKSSFIVFAAAGLMALGSCSKDTNIFNEEDAQAAAIKAHVEKVFGVTFDPNQDWTTATSGEVTVLTDASVKKVLLLVKIQEVFDDNVPSYVTRYALKQLNEAVPNGRTSIKMSYDVPNSNFGLYVCFITEKGNYFKKVEGSTVSMNGANARATRADSDEEDYNKLPLPACSESNPFTCTINEATVSYANERGWNEGELLYGLYAKDNDYSSLKMNLNKYTEPGFTDDFQLVLETYYRNGRGYNNLPRVLASKLYNEDGYATTDGKHVVIVSPIYKRDQPIQYGYEVFNSDLYYYYYRDGALDGKSLDEARAYLKALPKYKAFPFNQTFTNEEEDDKACDHGSFALLFYGDGTPTVGETQFEAKENKDFVFPEGYKIGFMVRAKTEAETEMWKGKRYYSKQGEVYADGRLNKEINTTEPWNFTSSGLDETDPRATWINIGGKLFLSWESGTDADFNDIVFEVEGVSAPTPDPSFEPNTYTYCFEDTDQGDYDMNDVVVKAVRENATTVRYYIEACGAYDELYIRNFKYDEALYPDIKINKTEVHALFNSEQRHFINTQGKEYEPIEVTRTVDEDFKLLEEGNLFYVENKTTNKKIYLSKKGQDPHAIMVAYDFSYPREKVCIKDAYKWFNKWGSKDGKKQGDTDIVTTGWFIEPVSEDLVCSWFVLPAPAPQENE